MPSRTAGSRALSGSAHVLLVAYMKGEEGQAVEVKDFVQPSSGGLGIKVDPSNVISQISQGEPPTRTAGSG